MAIAATWSIQRIVRSVILLRRWFATLTRMIHQIIDPQNIPATRSEVCHSGRCRPMPSVARTARNESTVVGLVTFRKNAETKSEFAEDVSGPASSYRDGLR